eukprot:4525774-Pleurochrysis_carterae.AAC.1
MAIQDSFSDDEDAVSFAFLTFFNILGPANRSHNPVSLTVPTAIASPRDGAYVQFRGAPTTGQTV